MMDVYDVYEILCRLTNMAPGQCIEVHIMTPYCIIRFQTFFFAENGQKPEVYLDAIAKNS